MNRPGIAEFFTLATALLLIVGLFEVLVRYDVIPLPEPNHLEGWRREAWLRRHPTGEQTTRFAGVDCFDSTLGWTLCPDLDDVELSGSGVSSNSAGFRGRREVAPSHDGRDRWVSVGDSFAFGECVGDRETYSAGLESLRPGVEVLNLAVHGYGHDQMLLRLRNEGFAHDPDVVLLGYYESDVRRNTLAFRDFAKPRFRLRAGDLVLGNVPVPSPEEVVSEFRPRILNYLQMLWDEIAGHASRDYENELAQAILGKMAAEVAQHGARFAVVLLPEKEQLLAGPDGPLGGPVYESICSDPAITCIDPSKRIHEFLARQDDPDSFFDCHYAPEIHALIADEIAAVMFARNEPGD